MTTTAEFFDEVHRRGHDPLLRRVNAVVRFETTGGDERVVRLVRIDHGDVTLSTADSHSDAVFRCSTAEFEGLINGQTTAMASLLRGTLTVEGDPELLVLAQRMFSWMPVEAKVPRMVGDREEPR
jgi:putative sterol carrier protein